MSQFLRIFLPTLATIADALQKQIHESKYFLEMYLQLDLIINELKDMLQNGLFYLKNLTQLNFLNLGRLSVSSTSPRNLRQLLSEIKSKLPTTLSLIGDPAKDLFLFYRQLASSALPENDRIIIVLSIPVLHTSNQFVEIFKAHGLPLTIRQVKTDNDHAPDMIATYDLEAHGLMIDQGRTKYALP